MGLFDWLGLTEPGPEYPRYALVIEDGEASVEEINDVVKCTAVNLKYGGNFAYVDKDFDVDVES
jgi:hypothetical protein